jgi:hypothetical protein
MLKQSFSKAKKVLTILLAVLFVAPLEQQVHAIHMDIITVAAPTVHTCSHGQCCNGVSCHKCSSSGEIVCEN